MLRFPLRLFILLAPFLLLGCANDSASSSREALLDRPWAEIEQAARGQTVNWMMWQGDPLINAYVQDYVAPTLQERYDITLQVASGQGNVIVSTLMTELEAAQAQSELDLIWINGETFFQLREIEGLFGPFVPKLPYASYLALDNRFIGTDFQQPTEGYECPWGTVQQALIYDSARILNPPMTRPELAAWVEAHPGRFTLTNEFTGMSLLKAWLADLAGGRDALNGPFDPELYDRYAPQLWAYVNAIKPYFWKQGETFPPSLAALHQLFASGEVDFTMSMNDNEVDNKILQGVFPATARAYVPAYGSIRNGHYLGIPARSGQKAAALVAINFLISPEAQFEKLKPRVWGDGTVLRTDSLPDPWPARFQAVPDRQYAPARDDIMTRAIMEPAPEYMIRLYEDFRREVIEQ